VGPQLRLPWSLFAFELASWGVRLVNTVKSLAVGRVRGWIRDHLGNAEELRRLIYHLGINGTASLKNLSPSSLLPLFPIGARALSARALSSSRAGPRSGSCTWMMAWTWRPEREV
jgi:hypothetical protein